MKKIFVIVISIILSLYCLPLSTMSINEEMLLGMTELSNYELHEIIQNSENVLPDDVYSRLTLNESDIPESMKDSKVSETNAGDADYLYAKLNEATGIAGWFNGSSTVFVEYDEDDIRIDERGRELARVTNGISTLQKLKEKLETSFSAEITDYYLKINSNQKRFIEYDGSLYYLKNFNSTAQRINRTLDSSNSEIDILSSDDGIISFRLTLPGEMDHKYSYVYTLEKKNGTFVFTDYVLPSDVGFKTVPGTGVANPQTSDSPVYIAVAAALVSACGAALVIKRRCIHT